MAVWLADCVLFPAVIAVPKLLQLQYKTEEEFYLLIFACYNFETMPPPRSVLWCMAREVYKVCGGEYVNFILTLWARLPSCPVGAAGRVLAKHSDPSVPLGLYSLYVSYGACTRSIFHRPLSAFGLGRPLIFVLLNY